MLYKPLDSLGNSGKTGGVRSLTSASLAYGGRGGRNSELRLTRVKIVRP